MMSRRVAIIGAGPSGLVAAKELLAAGIQCVVFDQLDQIGGRWAYSEASFCYDSLVSNISRDLSVFGDFPAPVSYPHFPSRKQILDYFQAYASHHDLSRVIRLRHSVEQAVPLDRNDPWTSWNIRVVDLDSQRRQEQCFDAILVCTGPYARPRWPGVALEAFQGQVSHASTYRSPEQLRGKRVLLVGSSASGCDIASDISEAAANITIAVRSPFWLMSTLDRAGRPTDQGLSRFKEYLPEFIRDPVATWIVSQGHKELTGYGLPTPTTRFADTRIVQSSALAEAIRRDRIAFRPALSRVGAHEAVFTDGSTIEVDHILCATGYHPACPSWLDADAIPAGLADPAKESLQLYRHILSPKYGSLGFIGHVRVNGSSFPIMEMQARWFAGLMRGAIARPLDTEVGRAMTEQATHSSGSGLVEVSFIRYLDTLASEIGCLPDVWSRLLSHPRLFWRLCHGPAFPAMYRLDGPGAWDRAEAFLLGRPQPAQSSTLQAAS